MAEMRAHEAAAQKLKELGQTAQTTEELPVVSILVNETGDDAVLSAGFFGRWTSFDEKEGSAVLEAFHKYRKPDGYVLAGAWRQKPLTTVQIRRTTCDFFNGECIVYDDDAVPAVQQETSDDDDETYVDHDE